MSLPVEDQVDAKEFKIPVGLLVAGVGLYLAHTFFLVGQRGVAVELVYLTIALVIEVVLGILACFLAARILSTSYGDLFSACVKLAAIFIFPGALAIFINVPILSGVVRLLLYWGLIAWLFELDQMETFVTIIVIFFVQLGAFIFTAAILASVLH